MQTGKVKKGTEIDVRKGSILIHTFWFGDDWIKKQMLFSHMCGWMDG